MTPLNTLVTDLIVLFVLLGALAIFTLVHRAHMRGWEHLVGVRALGKMGLLDETDSTYIDPKTATWLRVGALGAAEIATTPLMGRLIWMLMPPFFATVVFVAVVLYVVHAAFATDRIAGVAMTRVLGATVALACLVMLFRLMLWRR